MICSIAFLLEELKENTLHKTIRDLVTIQLNEIGKDLKDFITDTTLQINSHVEEKLLELLEAMKDLVESVTAALSDLPLPSGTTKGEPTLDYRQALLHHPPSCGPMTHSQIRH